MNRQIYVDLDGVLADFDGYYAQLFGVIPKQDTYEPADMWDRIREAKTFYYDIPETKDAFDLWGGIQKFHPKPIILTGTPEQNHNIPGASLQKEKWVYEHFGFITTICCLSRNKHMYGRPGDILIDDRLKYSNHWADMGGIFILHTSTPATLEALANLYNPVSP